jgi:hypothetical protein
MQPWAFYPAFLGTFISLIGWCYLAVREHDRLNPLTLSEVAATRPDTLQYFRIVLWTCGPLFALTMYFFVVPRIAHGEAIAIAWSLALFGEIVLGIFPASGKTFRLHSVLGIVMAFSMLLLTYAFWWAVPGILKHVEMILALCMSLLIILFTVNRKNILFHELLFIFMSHFSILVATIALR